MAQRATPNEFWATKMSVQTQEPVPVQLPTSTLIDGVIDPNMMMLAVLGLIAIVGLLGLFAYLGSKK